MTYTKTAKFELIYPFLISIGLSIITYIFSSNFDLNFKEFVNSALNVFGILIGFLITVLTIINSIENSYTRALKKGGAYHLLSVYLKHAIWGCFLSIVIGISHVLFFNSLIEAFQNLANAMFTFSFVFALLASYRFIKIFLKLSLKK